MRGRVSEGVKGGCKYRMIEKVRSNLGHTDLEMMDERKDGEKMESKKIKKCESKMWSGWCERVLREMIKRQGDEGGGGEEKRLKGEELFRIFHSSQWEYLIGLSVKFNYVCKTPS